MMPERKKNSTSTSLAFSSSHLGTSNFLKTRSPFAGALYGTYEAFRYKVRTKRETSKREGGGQRRTKRPQKKNSSSLFLPPIPPSKLYRSKGPRGLQDPVRGTDHAFFCCRVWSLLGSRELAALRAGARVNFVGGFFFRLSSPVVSFIFLCKNFPFSPSFFGISM